MSLFEKKERIKKGVNNMSLFEKRRTEEKKKYAWQKWNYGKNNERINKTFVIKVRLFERK